jgi:hypothetical protein
METPVRLVITVDSREALRELIRQEDLDLDCGGVRQTADGELTIEAYAPEAVAARLTSAGYRVAVDQAFASRSAQRQVEVGTGDRFAVGQIAPQGLGRKE